MKMSSAAKKQQFMNVFVFGWSECIVRMKQMGSLDKANKFVWMKQMGCLDGANRFVWMKLIGC